MVDIFVPKHSEADLEYGFVVDETSPGVGVLKGVYGRNNTGPHRWLKIQQDNMTRSVELPGRTNNQQRQDLPTPARVACQTDEDGRWEFTYTRFVVGWEREQVTN